jgi:hypothetical protein
MNQILPLAITMMVGPQIITAIILITAKSVIKPSLAYVGGVAFATITGTLFFAFIAGLFSLQDAGSGEPTALSKIVQSSFVLLLIFASIITYINRASSTLPKWMSNLQTIDPKGAFKTALKLIYLMPTDIIIMSTVGIYLASRGADKIELLPFVALTTLIAALPLLTYMVFRKRAVKAMPKVREWMNSNSWVVSIAAYVIFIFLIW